MHKFEIGQAVAYRHSLGRGFGADGIYVVAKQLPPGDDGEPVYCIKRRGEPHARSARERELRATHLDPGP